MIERKLKISNNKNRRDVKWVDLYTDLYIVIGEMLKGKMSISDYLVSLNGEKTDAVLSFEDLKPFIMETILLPYLWKER
jgi:hypothetical protein